jgi:hypothetical protein
MPSRKMSRPNSRYNITENHKQYLNISQHIEYNHFVRTAHSPRSCMGGVFGQTQIFVATVSHSSEGR